MSLPAAAPATPVAALAVPQSDATDEPTIGTLAKGSKFSDELLTLFVEVVGATPDDDPEDLAEAPIGLDPRKD